MKNVVAIYPGTFDPLTKGHEDLIVRASKLWTKVVVAVAVAHHKKTLFTCDERMDMARQVLSRHDNVEVFSFSGLLKDFVETHHASVIVRGLRAVGDFDYEFQMAGMNRHLMPAVETIFLTPSQQYHFVSATFVREIGLLGGDIRSFVDPLVEKRLLAKQKEQAADAFIKK